jgi:methyl-accepting chemotaxis protein
MDDYERGLKEGRVDARLEEHEQRLDRINGSLDRFAASSEDLAASMRELASEIRTLQEGGRLAEQRVETTRKTLAEETERRKEALEVTADALSKSEESDDRTFSKRERIAALLVTITFSLIGIYLATH